MNTTTEKKHIGYICRKCRGEGIRFYAGRLHHLCSGLLEEVYK